MFHNRLQLPPGMNCPVCHVERSRDISHRTRINSERFLHFGRNDRSNLRPGMKLPVDGL